jgi:hypothetical protein
MGWFRTCRSFGGGLALFALALQLYLSFGHIHPDDIYGPAKLPLSSATQIALPTAGAGQSLTVDHTASQPDDICAICATMYMLGSSSIPEAPRVLPVARIARSATHFIHIAEILAAPRRAPFQSRAPPAA